MTKFLYIYSGGKYPETPEEVEAVMGKWTEWMGGLGDKLIDGGAPLAAKAFVGGASDSGANGYSVIEADDLAAATAIAEAHPHKEFGGAIEVAEFAQM